MGKRIIAGKPFVAGESPDIMRYCLDDTRLLELLFGAMLPDIENPDQALLRGE
jgi:hypothetical protein